MQRDFGEDKTLISVVVPLFNEQENLPELYRRLTAALEREGERFELVLVNDGSRDATSELLETLHRQDWRVVAVHLSRNFGHQAAICAGLDEARGQAVIVMDGDLQDPPEVLGRFLAAWRQAYEVVYAVRAQRKESLWKRVAYAGFYRVLRALSELDIPLDSGDFCLMDRLVVDTIKNMPERNRFVRGLRSFPLALITYLGLFLLSLALLTGGGLAIDCVHRQQLPQGWSLTLFAVLFVGALQMLSLGIVGQYVRRIFLETKGRPTYVIGSLRRTEMTRERTERVGA